MFLLKPKNGGGAVLCGTTKCKASWSVSHPGVIHEGLIMNTAMAMEQWCKSCQALINNLPNLRLCKTESLWCPVPFHGKQKIMELHTLI